MKGEVEEKGWVRDSGRNGMGRVDSPRVLALEWTRLVKQMF
jgi:hypothetical protein